MAHPVQTVLESLYAAERCPRLHVNAMKDGVVCPDFIRDQWKDRLVIDLDASYPLSLEMNDDGLSADLSFGGYVSRCSFPWSAIYVVSDRDSGRGIVLEQNVPASVRAQMEAAKRPKPRLAAVEDLPSDEADAAAPAEADERDDDDPRDDDDHDVDDADDDTDAKHDADTEKDDADAEQDAADDDTDAENDAEAVPPAVAEAGLVHAATEPAPAPDDTGLAAPEPITKHSSEEQERVAQRRRAAFRVIDGGS